MRYEYNNKEIEFSKGTKTKIKDLLYDALLNRDRVRIRYKKGYADFTGYHDKTGLIHTCFVGISTGQKPILLEIPSNRSIGGSALSTSLIEEVEILKKVERWV